MRTHPTARKARSCAPAPARLAAKAPSAAHLHTPIQSTAHQLPTVRLRTTVSCGPVRTARGHPSSKESTLSRRRRESTTLRTATIPWHAFGDTSVLGGRLYLGV